MDHIKTTDLEDYVRDGAWMLKPASEKDESFLRMLFRSSLPKWQKRYVWVDSAGICYGEVKDDAKAWVPFGEITFICEASTRGMEAAGAPFEVMCEMGLRIESAEKALLMGFVTKKSRDYFLEFLRRKLKMPKNTYYDL